jgi:hypothetical protein
MLARSATPPASSNPSLLLTAFWTLLQAHRPAFHQERPFRRAEALLLGQLFSFARRTITQALVSLGLTDHDWSSFYRLVNEPRIDNEALTGCFLQQTLAHIAETEPYVAVVDGVQISRHSHKMSGT